MLLRILFTMCCSIVLLSEPVLAQARFPFLGEATADRINVRAGQNNNFESLATLDKGAGVVVLDKSFKWYKVRLPQGAKAFIKASYVSLITPQVGEVTADRVNVRAAPNTTATVLGQVKKGKKFSIKENQGEWLWMDPVDEVNGWVFETLVAFKSDKVPSLISPTPVPVQKVVEPKPVVKASELKMLDNGQAECAGTLTKIEGDAVSYKIVHQGVTACRVEGPQEVLGSFVGGQVIVQGPVKPGSDPETIAVARIRRSF